jgi:hypothetical protein
MARVPLPVIIKDTRDLLTRICYTGGLKAAKSLYKGAPQFITYREIRNIAMALWVAQEHPQVVHWLLCVLAEKDFEHIVYEPDFSPPSLKIWRDLLRWWRSSDGSAYPSPDVATSAGAATPADNDGSGN